MLNTRLERMTEKSKRLEVSGGRHKTKRGWKTCVTIQKYANKLHRALSMAWTCSSHPAHRINLRLDQRIEDSSGGVPSAASDDDSTSFALTFGSPSAPYEWWNIEVHVAGDLSSAPWDSTKRC